MPVKSQWLQCFKASYINNLKVDLQPHNQQCSKLSTSSDSFFQGTLGEPDGKYDGQSNDANFQS